MTRCISCEKSIKVVSGDYIAATNENGVTQFYCIECASEEFGADMVQLVLNNKGFTYQVNESS